ncbi:CGNR zinc finger domain-containing protein [Actinoplanes ianthinogenes]|uniref:CGNR zinc finger domain-containing protein n=1 Tax=Actinoplanes ianthinogenes TaxID=122358 RepID=UPI001BB33BA9|nr:CGNR zinc finger domain-containing protein [Actinoplanes ianthinogenes]
MTVHDPLALRYDCGAVWLNLLATRGRSFSADPVERLTGVDRLAEWLAHSELSPVRAPGPEDLELTREVRETLRPLALATVDGVPPPPAAADRLVTLLAGQDAPVRLIADERLRLAPPATAREALARITRQAIDQLTGADRHVLKVCPEDDCRGVFIDPPGRRRWCPSPACASRGRVRALRARRAAHEQ